MALQPPSGIIQALVLFGFSFRVGGDLFAISLEANLKPALQECWLGLCPHPLICANAVDAIRIQHIRQGHDAFQLVKIRPVDDRQDIKMVFAHAFERQMQGMIRVDVRNMEGFHKACHWLLFSSIDKGALKSFSVQDSKKVSLVDDWPDAETDWSESASTASSTRHLRGEYLRRVPHDLSHCALAEFVASAVAGQMNAILMGQCLVDRLLLKSGRDEEAGQVCNHQRHDDSVIPRHFKDHQYRCHGGAHDTREERAHADQRVSARGCGVSRQQAMGYGADGPSQHCAEKQTRAEDSTSVSGGIADSDAKELEDHEQQHQLERHRSIQSAADIAIPDAQDLGHKPAHQANRHTAHYGMPPAASSWEDAERTCAFPTEAG